MFGKSTVAVAVALVAGFVAAQSSPFGSNTTVDPSTVDATTRGEIQSSSTFLVETVL
jgi:hypothetical protein